MQKTGLKFCCIYLWFVYTCCLEERDQCDGGVYRLARPDMYMHANMFCANPGLAWELESLSQTNRLTPQDMAVHE